jgi:hypothetical protein
MVARRSPTLPFVAMLLAAFLALAVLPAGIAHAKRQGTTYFFTDTATPVDAHNPLVVRPSGFVLFQDGQWVLEGLRWTGWGSSVAHATGLSSSSNDVPNAAEGKRIIQQAKVTLSKPGRFQGHRVYRCFRLTIPASPKSKQYLCLQHVGSTYLLASPGTGQPV